MDHPFACPKGVVHDVAHGWEVMEPWLRRNQPAVEPGTEELHSHLYRTGQLLVSKADVNAVRDVLGGRVRTDQEPPDDDPTTSCLDALGLARIWVEEPRNEEEPPLPALVDITTAAGIRFRHLASPEKKYIVESMSGGVLLLDYDRDGWQDIYFTNAPTVEMALAGRKARSALYRNNGDGRFADVTDRAGVGFPGYAMGGAVTDYDNDGWPDIYVTCLGGNVLYRNNGDGTFTDVTRKAGVADGRWSAGAAFGDYDADGDLHLAVANYVDFKLNDLPGFGSAPTCKFRASTCSAARAG